MATKKKVPMHKMPDGSVMPGKTHADYMNKMKKGVVGNPGSTGMMGPTQIPPYPKKKASKK